MKIAMMWSDVMQLEITPVLDDAAVAAVLEKTFFFHDPATTEIYTPLYTLSLHDALPIYGAAGLGFDHLNVVAGHCSQYVGLLRSEEHTSELQSHSGSSYAVFCLKKK